HRNSPATHIATALPADTLRSSKLSDLATTATERCRPTRPRWTHVEMRGTKKKVQRRQDILEFFPKP
ncbi:UNVERIFIED_CONTAM: hypothetical protein NY603_28390, partial [Bacteroidetes bacterium 56_B9]